ncbi:NAD(P)-binding protein [Terfezia boudieri ATCC MYA-4762]|uniref:alcohol dehydrogenase n=1 Tax=Terfezia boudieri ATCC MYA-4762 TaxID=1051890 RepID=A0A3N4LW40_9PEZI|nr:NAD(P)-binding protein [Terfezia boudieri ATCC MYA-4762]
MAAKEEIPKLQWAQVFDKCGEPLQYKQISVPIPESDEVLVKIKYSGVCHTDLHAWKGDWPLGVKTPLVGGHEGALCPGQRADEQLCAKQALSGYTVNGSFQQYAIANAMHVARIPPECKDLAAVAPILCAGLTVYKALKQSRVIPGQTVAITGAGGGLGSLACQYAKAMGLEVLAIDTSEEKRDLCINKLGATSFIDFATTKDIVADVKAATGGLGPHAVIVVAASEKPFAQAAEYVRPHGTVVCVGLPHGARASADVFTMVTKMINICGSYVGNRAETQEALDFFKKGKIGAPIQIRSLQDLPLVYKEIEEMKIAGRVVLEVPE